MKQSERAQKSKMQILEAAMQEFGMADYTAVSVEHICKEHGISKGLMYHYYTGKDALFLACVSKVFDALAQYLCAHLSQIDTQDPRTRIRDYFLLRDAYFAQRPLERHVFENAMFHAPPQLAPVIAQKRKPLVQINARFIADVVETVGLRDGITKQEAIQYLESVEVVFWMMLRFYGVQDITQSQVFLQYTERLLDMLLYGIVGRQDAVVKKEE